MEQLTTEHGEHNEDEQNIDMDIVKRNPPTQEEMMGLREAKVVIQSNLFKMQIDELLKEMKPNDKLLLNCDDYLKEILALICHVSYPFGVEVERFENLSVLSDQVLNEISKFDRSRAVTPISVQIVGSHLFDCDLKNFMKIDLVVKLRKILFDKMDYTKDVYERRIKFYALFLAHTLKNSEFIQSTGSKITIVTSSSADRIALRIRSPVIPDDTTDTSNNCDIYVRLIPERNTFKLMKIEKLWQQNMHLFFSSVLVLDESKKTKIIAHHVALLGQDLVCLSNDAVCYDILQKPNMRGAFVLLKVWMLKRQLNEGYGCVGNFLVRMFMVYLYKTKRINDAMSSYQIVRNVWVAFGKSEWNIQGISLAEVMGNVSKRKPTLEMFHQRYDVVFVDASGCVNLAGLVNVTNYIQLKNQSLRALDILKQSSVSAFKALFIVPVELLSEFDQVICIRDLNKVSDLLGGVPSVNLEYCNNVVPRFLDIVLPVIKKGTSDRVERGFVKTVPPTLSWDLDMPPPMYEKIIIGLTLHKINALRLLDKGPLANFPQEGDEFCLLWGETELRRFPDGTVYESVLFAKKDSLLNELRSIVQKIVDKLLYTKFRITEKMYTIVGNQLEPVFRSHLADLAKIRYGTGEEATINVLRAFGKLTTVLYELEDLPLDIVSVQGSTAVFRYTDPFPALPVCLLSQLSPVDNSDVPPPPMEKQYSDAKPNKVIIKFTSSGKWPNDDQDAIKRVKAAMYVSLAEKLTSKHSVVKCAVNVDYVDVFQDGFIFRLKIFCPAEITGIKKQITSDGVVEYVDTEESRDLEKDFIFLPTLTGYLAGLHQKYPTYGPTCSLAKIWLNSLMVDDYHLSDICVDLLVASLFLSPYPYEPSMQPQTMFLRFLKLMASTNWCTESVVVNFDNAIREEEISKLQSKINQRPESVRLTIITPLDSSGTLWTSRNPLPCVLGYISLLANNTLEYLVMNILELSFNYKIIFEPCRNHFDYLIELTSAFVSSKSPKNTSKLIDLTDNSEDVIIGFNPVRDFLDEIRQSFGHFFLFFYNAYNVDVIGVLINPENVNVPQDIKVKTFTGCSKLLPNGKEITTDADDVIDQIRIMGKHIVKNVVKKNT